MISKVGDGGTSVFIPICFIDCRGKGGETDIHVKAVGHTGHKGPTANPFNKRAFIRI